MDYAVFKTGGKQYRVKPGDTLDVEKLATVVNGVAEFREVMAVADQGEVTFGSPHVQGARVVAEVQSHYKDRKVVVFKYKRKTRYRRKRGHRQAYTRLVIRDILVDQPTAQTGQRRRRTQTGPSAEQEGSDKNGA